jgi:phage-related protein
MGSSLDDIKTFPAAARREIGYQLYKVQHGLEPSDWKPMAGLGHGVQEIRVHTGSEYRVIYVAKFERAVYVLHAFMKKTNRTPKGDLNVASARLKQVLRERGTRS